MSARITWSAAADGGQTGSIHGKAHGYQAEMRLFQIETSPDGYRLRHRLPFQQLPTVFPTPGDAQKHAERFLIFALELMGFVPKETAA